MDNIIIYLVCVLLTANFIWGMIKLNKELKEIDGHIEDLKRLSEEIKNR